MRDPNTLKKYLSADQHKLYDLIWSRALSSQMESAQFDRNTITITSDDNGTICKASGSVIKFDGFLKVIKDNKKDDDEIAELNDRQYGFIRNAIIESCLKNIIKLENNTIVNTNDKDWFTEKILSGETDRKKGNKRLKKLK